MAYVTRHNARRGTAAVEAALMMPIVVFLTFGLLTYAWVFIRSGQITNAARQGARVAARADSTTQNVEDHVTALMATAGIPFSAASDLTVVYADLPFDPDPDDPDASSPGTTVTVTITVDYRGTDAELIKMGAFMPVPTTLKSEATMFKEGPGG